MTDTYDALIRARAANMALQHLVNEHRKALVALVAQPFSPACIAQAKAVASTQIDTAIAEQHYEEFMELWRQVHGEHECHDFSNCDDRHSGNRGYAADDNGYVGN